MLTVFYDALFGARIMLLAQVLGRTDRDVCSSPVFQYDGSLRRSASKVGKYGYPTGFM